MRVLHVSPYFPPALRYGGPPASILALCQGLQHAGVDVEVLTTTANGASPLKPSPPAGDTYEGVPVRYLPQAFPARVFAARMREPLTEALERADVCHIHGIWNMPEWSAARLARDQRVPYVISPRGMLEAGARRRGRVRKALAFSLVERANLRGAARLHASSDDEAATLRALTLGVPIDVVPNPVDLEAARSAAGGFRERLGIARDAFVVMFLGRMHRIKRLDLLAEAFMQVRAADPSVHLVLAGPDEESLLPGLKRVLAPHAAAVHITGPVFGSDKWALLRDADVTVQCSDSESFGLAIAESLAAGVPAIATHTVPWRALETHGCGLWVDQRADAIAAAIVDLRRDPERRAVMKKNAAAYAAGAFGPDAVAVAMKAVYLSALGAGACS